MKRKIVLALLLFVLILSACGHSETASSSDKTNSNSEASKSTDNGDPKTITYQSENGPVEVPANPKRVIVLGISAGHVMKLGVNIVGVDTYAMQNPNYQKYLKGVEEVSEDDLEKIASLKPDLIIGYSTTKNIDRLKKIAPTVTYTYGKLDYLSQFEAIGKLLNKENEAKAWVEDFKQRAHTIGVQVKDKIGPDATVSVVEKSGKEWYVFGDNWGRGTEILYQEMKLNMPKDVKDKALKPGYFALSEEVLSDYFGDYVILSLAPGEDTAFGNSETYKNIPAVKNHHVYKVDTRRFSFNDPISLDYQLDFFKKAFLGD